MFLFSCYLLPQENSRAKSYLVKRKLQHTLKYLGMFSLPKYGSSQLINQMPFNLCITAATLKAIAITNIFTDK